MEAKRDQNHVTTLLGVSSADGVTPLNAEIDPLTGRLLVDSASGSGDVSGPGSSTDNAVARWDGVTGTQIQNSVVLIGDTGAITGVLSIVASGTFYSSTGLILEETGAGSDTITLQAPSSISASYTLTLPVDDGTSNQVLTTDGGGVLSWTTPTGTGDVVGPASATDNAVARFDGTTGKLIQNSAVTIADTSGDITAGKYNGLTVTATTGTLTITNGKTLSISNTLTFTGTDGSSVAFGTGGTVLYTASTIPLTVGSSTIASGTTTRILYDNAGVLGEYTLTGSGTVVAMATAPTFVTSITTPSVLATANDSGALGASGTAFSDLFLASGGVINWASSNVVVTHTSGILTIGTGTLKITNPTNTSTSVVTIDGTQTLTNKSIVASQITTGTFGTGAYTMDTSLAVPQVFSADHAATVSTNAATITRAFRNNTFTNSSAATMAITLSTSGATGGDMLLIQIYDFSAVAQTIGWTNTENSTVTAPTTSNGSTTLPLTVGFKWNASTSKWRCIASA